jgi:hypothetical protein
VRNPFEKIFSEWYRSRFKWLRVMRDPNSWIYKYPDKVNSVIEAVENNFSDWVELRYGKKYDRGEKLNFFARYIEGVDYVVKIEELESELRYVLEKLGIDVDIEIVAKNVTLGDKEVYWQHYNRKARDIVSTVFEPDLNRFSYTF